MSIKVVIIDDHKIIREGIKLYLQNDDDYEVVGEGKNGKEAISQIEKKKVDLIIMDINMDVMDGIEATKKIKQIDKNIKIVALTMYNDYLQIKAMMDAGASGYLLKNCNEEELKDALQTVIGDDIYYSKIVEQTVINNLTQRVEKVATEYLPTPLTPREKEVYKLIMEEHSNQEIADLLFISVRTVEVHKRNLLEKTGAKNTTGLVLYAIKKDLYPSKLE